MKRTVIALFAIVLVCLGVVVIAPSFVDFSTYKDKAAQEFKQRTGMDINLDGEIALSILPTPRLTASNVSILSPENSKAKNLASFERLEVNLDLMPLFSGKVSVNSVTLVKPIIALEMYKNGRLNFELPQKEAANNIEESKNASSSKTVSLPDISLDKISIKDGSFSYFDHKSGQNTALQNINADLSADSLTGPFKVSGSLFYDGNALNFDVKTDKYDSESKIISPNVKLTMKPSNISLEYAGVLNLGKDFYLQGQTEILSKNLKSSLSSFGIKNISGLGVSLKAKGLVSINKSSLDYKSINVSLGDQKVKGSLRVDFAPFKFSSSFKSVEIFKVQEVMGKGAQFKTASFDVSFSGNDAAISLKKSDIILDDQKFKISGKYIVNKKTARPEITANIDISDIYSLAHKFNIDTQYWDKKYQKANVKTKLLNIGGDVDITINISALGGEIIAKGGLSNLSFHDLVLQLKHKNMTEMVYLFTGAKLNSSNLNKPVNLYMIINQSGDNYIIKDIKGDLSGITVQGGIDLNLSGVKPNIKGDLSFGSLNIDSVMGQNSGKNGSRSAGNNSKKVAQTAINTSTRWSKEIIDTSALHAVNFDLALSSKKIEYGVWPLIEPEIKLQLKDGELNISKLEAGLFSGKIDFMANLKSVPKPRQPVNFDSVFSIKNADLGKLSTALIGKQIIKISGKGDLDMNIKSSGASPAALISDLSGSGKVDGTNIILDGVDITNFARALSDNSKAGDTILGIWGAASKGGQTRFDTLDGAFDIKNGIVDLQKMDLDGVQSAIKTRGNINLPSWRLATKHKIIVKGIDGKKSDIPEFEVSFNGSLDNPAQTFGKGLLEDYLNRKIKRKLNKLLTDKLGKKLGLPSVEQPKPSTTSSTGAANDNNAQQQPQAVENQLDNGGASNDNEAQKQKAPDIEDVAEEAIKGLLDGLLR